MLKLLRRLMITILVAIIVLYVGAVAGLYALQRTLLYPGWHGMAIEPPKGGPYRNWTVAVPDGETLTLWRGAPAARGMPTFVMFHGNGSDTSDFAELGERFQARGWGVVLASYRGFSGNPGSPSEAGLMADARAILAAVGDPGGPVILWGHSLGSGVAARMAAEGRGAALVLESPYTSVADRAAQLYPIFPVRLLIKDKFDTAALVPDIKVPVLVIHSMDDRTIPVAMGRAVAASLGSRATAVILNGLGHFPHAADLSGTVAQWLQAQHVVPDLRSALPASGE